MQQVLLEDTYEKIPNTIKNHLNSEAFSNKSAALVCIMFIFSRPSVLTTLECHYLLLARHV